MRYVCLLTLVASSVTVLPVLAQRNAVVHGELTCEHCTSYSGMVIDVTDSARQPISAAPIGTNGSFELHNIRDGAYHVAVRDSRGGVLHQEIIQVNSHTPVHITLPEQKVERPVSGTISVARLQHKVPKKARKEYEKADKKLKEGDIQGSLQHLLKAVEIDPKYMEAHNNLGSRYLMLNQHEKALDSFRRALDLDDSALLVQINMAVALMALNDHKQAEDVVRRVLRKNPSDPKARYLLGLALYSQKEYTNETVSLLEESEEHFPNAKLAVAAIHAMRGEPMKARTELEAYMTLPNATNRAQAKSMLAQLKKTE